MRPYDEGLLRVWHHQFNPSLPADNAEYSIQVIFNMFGDLRIDYNYKGNKLSSTLGRNPNRANQYARARLQELAGALSSFFNALCRFPAYNSHKPFQKPKYML